MNTQFRDRRPPIDRGLLYGEFAPLLLRESRHHKLVTDRAAYVYITGNLPSHLRPWATRALVQITREYPRPTSLDGLHGHRQLKEDAIRDLRLNEHDMVGAVRQRVEEGYRIKPSRGHNTRRGYSKIFMFRPLPDGAMHDQITVTLEGAIKRGWA